MTKIAILISGRGSNMAALLNAIKMKKLDCKVVCVIANQISQGLAIATSYNIPTKLIDRSSFDSKESHEIALASELLYYQPDWVLLAGYMAILSPNFIKNFEGKIINIHPSLLPKFKGLNTHHRAIKAGEKKHGTTIHIVTSELDDGPIIAQSEINLSPFDTSTTLKNRVVKQEHILYPLILESLLKKYLEITFLEIIWHQVPPIFHQEHRCKVISLKPYLKIKNLI